MRASRLASEELIPFKRMPSRIPGRPTYKTLRRWATVGYNGVLLEQQYIGKHVYTSIEAWNRFVEQTQPE